MTLRSCIDTPAPGSLPAVLGRTAYRVIQEGLTNARRHDWAPQWKSRSSPAGRRPWWRRSSAWAPAVSRRRACPGGRRRHLARAGAAGRGAGAGAYGRAGAGIGAGAGLIGLAERLALVGGGLEHGTNPAGDFVSGRPCRGPHDRPAPAGGPAPEASPIRVLLVDDDPLVRAGLTMMLAGAWTLQVVGEAEDWLVACCPPSTCTIPTSS